MKPTEATLVWERWRSRKRLKRNLTSWSVSLGLAAVTLAAAAFGFLPVFNVGEKGEALSVKLGNPEGEDLPLSVSAVPDQVMQAVMEAQRESARTTVEETRASVPESSPDPAAVPVAKTPEKVAPKSPAPTAKPVEKPSPANPPSDKPAVTEKVIRGVEKGNASELILKPQGEKISQNVYQPAYLSMPLPAKLDSNLLSRVEGKGLFSADERRATLLQFYTKGPDGLSLTADPGVEVRPLVWQILEQAGYDLASADYKRGKDLKPVVITFKIGVPDSNSGSPKLLDVKLEQSSGSTQVDEAVLYAFKNSSFANGTGQVAQGRYTYDFSGKK